jgi:hypothetical protein
MFCAKAEMDSGQPLRGFRNDERIVTPYLYRTYFVMLSSAGAPTSVRLGEQVMIMISSVRK